MFAKLMAPVEALAAADLEQPMTAGKWSWKDMAAHFIFWDKITVRALEAAYQGQTFNWKEYSDWDGLNNQAVVDMRNDPLSRVVNAWRVTYSTLMEAMARVPDERLLVDGRIPDWLMGAVLDHYRHHALQVEEWADAKRKAGSGGLPVLG